MNTVSAKKISIGVLAGLTAALLLLGAGKQMSVISVLIIYTASALPILIAGLGWGNSAAIAAVAAGAALSSVLVSPLYALAVTLAALCPAAWLSHLANLARPASELGGPDHLLAWYPLSDILLHLCGLQAVALIVVGFVSGYDPEIVRQVVDVLAQTLAAQEPSVKMDPEIIAQWKVILPIMLPIFMGGMWVFMLFAAYYIANRIVNASSRGLRPREDVPSSLRMNRNSIFIFLTGLALSFFGGSLGLIGLIVVGTFGAGFLLSGFAALHFRTRGKDWRLPVLILLYLTSIVVGLPLLVVLVIGLLDTRKAIALTPVASDKSKSSDSTS
ncbi:DUF2232 domain-containing protein [Oryzifoliimicrobium ureilyticus]|uniref:DUF2232 domain-containing protein n=1 Tax=Oryzifoliimicrobium ureilyticus TaxID=3113724 RepID=UPI00307682EA